MELNDDTRVRFLRKSDIYGYLILLLHLRQLRLGFTHGLLDRFVEKYYFTISAIQTKNSMVK